MAQRKYEDAFIIERYLQYNSAYPAAKELGVSTQTIYRVLIRHNIPRIKPKPEKTVRVSNCSSKYCPALVVMLRTVTGKKYCEIKQITGIPGNSVSNIISKRGLQAPKHVTKFDVDMDSLEREYLDGASTYTLEKKYGVNHSTISVWMIERGHKRGRGNFKPGTEAALNVAEGRRKAIEKLSGNAKTRFLETYDDAYASVEKHRRARFVRKKRILERPRDLGINWRTVAERQGNMKCSICGCECNSDDKRWGCHGPTYPSVDHIQRIADGGSDTWDNVRLVCMHCNIKLNTVMRNAKKQTA